MSRFKYTLLVGTATCLLVFFWMGILPVGVETAYALAGGTAVFPVGVDGTIADITGKLITVLNTVTWIVFMYMIYLLNPNFIFDLGGGGSSGFMDMLNELWKTMRDLMNVAFAFMLIGMAIYLILQPDKKDIIREKAPRFIIAIFLINFSWFIPQVILDVANAGAAAAFGLPGIVGANECEIVSDTAMDTGCYLPPMADGKYRCPCKIIVDAKFFLETDAEVRDLKKKGYECPLGNIVCILKRDMEGAGIAGYAGILNGLVINHGRLQQLARVPAPPAARVGMQTLMLAVREIIILLIHIALLFPLVAILTAFAIRIPVIWLTMAAMPLAVTCVVLGLPGQLGEAGKKIWSYFLEAAFLPAKVGVCMSVGFILLNVGTKVDNSMSKIPIKLIDGMNDASQIFWMLLSFGILWHLVFTALRNSDLFGKAATTIENTGKTVGKVAVKAPLAATPIPLGDGKSISALGALKRLSPNKWNTELDRIGESGKTLREAMGGSHEQDTKDAAHAMRDTNHEQVKKLDQIVDALNKAHDKGDRTAAQAELNKLITEVKRGDGAKNTIAGTNEENLVETLKSLKKNGAGLKSDDAKFDKIGTAIKTLKTTPAPAPAPGGAPGTP